MLIENDKKMQGFRFYDRNIIIDDEIVYNGDEINFSNWIYFGERLSLENVIKKYPKNEILINNMRDKNYRYVCYTQANAFVPMSDGDSTYDEIILQIEENKAFRKEKK